MMTLLMFSLLSLAPQGPPNAVDEITKDLASEIRCPVCRGVSVEESPSDFAREMKAVIREKVAAGESRSEIRRYFADRYGDWVLLDPERSGMLLALWFLPAAAVLLGALGLVLTARRWLHTNQEDSPDPQRA